MRFVEVKGPGDSVSIYQRLWIGRLQALGVPTIVAHVREEAGGR